MQRRSFDRPGMHRRSADLPMRDEAAETGVRLRQQSVPGLWSRPAAYFRYGPPKKPGQAHDDDDLFPPLHWLTEERSVQPFAWAAPGMAPSRPGEQIEERCRASGACLQGHVG